MTIFPHQQEVVTEILQLASDFADLTFTRVPIQKCQFKVWLLQAVCNWLLYMTRETVGFASKPNYNGTPIKEIGQNESYDFSGEHIY